MITEQDYKKLTDLIYRRAGIFIGEKRFDILKPKLEAYMIKNHYKTFREYFSAIRFDRTNEKMQDLMNIITIN